MLKNAHEVPCIVKANTSISFLQQQISKLVISIHQNVIVKIHGRES